MTWAARRCRRFTEAIMEVIYPRCAGLDVHKQTVVACVRITRQGAPAQEVRTFTTSTAGLLALADWLESFGVEHVAMEATGVYWKPVWHVLEEGSSFGAGQRLARQERARAQDRRQRRDVARGPARARPDARQLRTACGGAGAARADPHAQAVRARARGPRAAHRQGARRRQPQARCRAQRHPRQERTRGAASAHRRSERP